MGEIMPAHGGGWEHREGFGERDACAARLVKHSEQKFFFRVVGASGIARRRAYAAVIDMDNLRVA